MSIPSPSAKPLRFVILGTGFWSRFQLAGWRETPGLECVGVWNRTRAKAEAFAREFDIPRVFDSAEEACDHPEADFVDIITDADSHAPLTRLAAAHGKAVVCQKPMAPELALAERMLADCRRAGVPLLINENWRWQAPLRALIDTVRGGAVGEVFRARLEFCNDFDVFANQPFLRELPRFILADLGVHVLDTARALFGDPATLYARTRRVNPAIRGEDVATVMLGYGADGPTVTCALSYARNPYERHRFPDTLAFVEGSRGTVELAPGGWLRVTTASGTEARQVLPPDYPWADPRYAVVHSSIAACQAHLAAALRGECAPETSGEDNLKTLRLVFAAYDSAGRETVVRL